MTYALLPAQFALLANVVSRWLAFIGGLGSGKTHGLCWKALQLAQLNAGVGPVLFVEPTYRMAMDVAYRELLKILEGQGIEHRWKASDMAFEVNTANGWGEIWLRSADRPERLQAINAAAAIIDEPAQIKEEAAQAVVNRVRIGSAPALQIVLGGTPDSMNWLYDWVEGSPPDDLELIRARTADNPHTDPQYLATITAHMDDAQREAMTEGRFCPPSGRVYHRFKRDHHVRQCANRWEGQLQLWCDFNVGRMVWILARRIGGELHAFHEFDVQDTDTQTQCQVVTRYLAQHGVRPNQVEAYPDASGAARRTSAPRSDIGWLSQAGFAIKAPAANPAVRDRVAAVNALLAKHQDVGGLYFDPACAFAIRCIETQGRDKRTGEPDKAMGLDHAADAIGYGVSFQFREFAPAGNSRKYT